MNCVVCGCNDEIEVHGHYQCAKCGRILDGDCCQGSQQNSREQIYRENRVRKQADNCQTRVVLKFLQHYI